MWGTVVVGSGWGLRGLGPREGQSESGYTGQGKSSGFGPPCPDPPGELEIFPPYTSVSPSIQALPTPTCGSGWVHVQRPLKVCLWGSLLNLGLSPEPIAKPL